MAGADSLVHQRADAARTCKPTVRSRTSSTSTSTARAATRTSLTSSRAGDQSVTVGISAANTVRGEIAHLYPEAPSAASRGTGRAPHGGRGRGGVDRPGRWRERGIRPLTSGRPGIPSAAPDERGAGPGAAVAAAPPEGTHRGVGASRCAAHHWMPARRDCAGVRCPARPIGGYRAVTSRPHSGGGTEAAPRYVGEGSAGGTGPRSGHGQGRPITRTPGPQAIPAWFP